MENENRIVELLAESLIKQDKFVDELRELKSEVRETNRRLEKVESEMIKLNLQTTENARAIFKPADEVAKIADLHQRVTKLEKEVYK